MLASLMVKVFLILCTMTVIFAASPEEDVCVLKAQFASWYLTNDTQLAADRLYSKQFKSKKHFTDWPIGNDRLSPGIHIFCLRPEMAFVPGEKTTVLQALNKEASGEEHNATIEVLLSDTPTARLSVSTKEDGEESRFLLQDQAICNPKTHTDSLSLSVGSSSSDEETLTYRLPFSSVSGTEYSLKLSLSSTHTQLIVTLHRNTIPISKTDFFPYLGTFLREQPKHFIAYKGRYISWAHLPTSLSAEAEEPSEKITTLIREKLALKGNVVAYAPTVPWVKWKSTQIHNSVAISDTKGGAQNMWWFVGTTHRMGANTSTMRLIKSAKSAEAHAQFTAPIDDDTLCGFTLTLKDNLTTECLVGSFPGSKNIIIENIGESLVFRQKEQEKTFEIELPDTKKHNTCVIC